MTAPARGSDAEYCSVYPADGHAYVTQSVQAYPIMSIRWCDYCGFIDSQNIRDQLDRKNQGTFVIDATIERAEELRADRLAPDQDDVVDPEIVRPQWAPAKTLN